MAASSLPWSLHACEIIQLLHLLTDAQHYTSHLGDPFDKEEEHVIECSILLLQVAEKILIQARNGETDPFALIPKNAAATYPNYLRKRDFLFYIDVFQSNVEDHLEWLRTSGQREPHSPGSSLQQQATLMCPDCTAPIPSSFGVQTHKGPDSSNASSMTVKVKILAKQMPDRGWDLHCPNCQKPVKTHLAAAKNGSNLYTIRVSLDKDFSGPRIYEPIVLRKALTFLHQAMQTFYDLHLHGVLDNINTQIVSKCMQTAYMILGTVENGSFRHSTWAETNEENFSPLVELEQFLKENIGFFNPLLAILPPPPPAQ